MDIATITIPGATLTFHLDAMAATIVTDDGTTTIYQEHELAQALRDLDALNKARLLSGSFTTTGDVPARFRA